MLTNILVFAGGPIGRAESDPRLDATSLHLTRGSDRSRSRVQAESSTKKVASSLPAQKPEENTALNTDFLPDAIRGILDDLQLDSATQAPRQESIESQNRPPKVSLQAPPRSHSPVKRKPDKVTASDEPPVISKKRHYDSDQVRQYIIRQQEERKRKQNEEKKAQKEATEQKNKRLQELYRRQKEAFAKGRNSAAEQVASSRRLQETYSKLLREKTLLKEPGVQCTEQDTQVPLRQDTVHTGQDMQGKDTRGRTHSGKTHGAGHARTGLMGAGHIGDRTRGGRTQVPLQ